MSQQPITRESSGLSLSVKNAKKWTPLFVLLFMIIVIGIWNPSFFQGGNAKTVLMLTSILLMAAIGQTWVVLQGSIDLSVGSMASLCSVIFALKVSEWGWNAFFLVLLVGIAGGLLNGLIFTLFRIPSFIATLGTGGLFLSLAYVFSNASSIAVANTDTPVLQLFGGSVLNIPVPILFVCLLWAVCLIYQRFTIGGRNFYYVGNSEPTAWMSGVRINRYKIIAFTVSGATAALTGFLLCSNIFNGSPSLGNPYVLKSISVVVIGGTALTGGVGGLGRTLVGALIMAILSNGMNVVGVNAYFQDIVTGAVIILASMASLDRTKIPVLK